MEGYLPSAGWLDHPKALVAPRKRWRNAAWKEYPTARKAHGVLLNALRGAFDGAQPRPACNIDIIHHRPPAEEVVTDEETRHHTDTTATRAMPAKVDNSL